MLDLRLFNKWPIHIMVFFPGNLPSPIDIKWPLPYMYMYIVIWEIMKHRLAVFGFIMFFAKLCSLVLFSWYTCENWFTSIPSQIFFIRAWQKICVSLTMFWASHTHVFSMCMSFVYHVLHVYIMNLLGRVWS